MYKVQKKNPGNFHCNKKRKMRQDGVSSYKIVLNLNEAYLHMYVCMYINN